MNKGAAGLIYIPGIVICLLVGPIISAQEVRINMVVPIEEQYDYLPHFSTIEISNWHTAGHLELTQVIRSIIHHCTATDYEVTRLAGWVTKYAGFPGINTIWLTLSFDESGNLINISKPSGLSSKDLKCISTIVNNSEVNPAIRNGEPVTSIFTFQLKPPSGK